MKWDKDKEITHNFKNNILFLRKNSDNFMMKEYPYFILSLYYSIRDYKTEKMRWRLTKTCQLLIN